MGTIRLRIGRFPMFQRRVLGLRPMQRNTSRGTSVPHVTVGVAGVESSGFYLLKQALGWRGAHGAHIVLMT